MLWTSEQNKERCWMLLLGCFGLLMGVQDREESCVLVCPGKLRGPAHISI